MNDEEAPPLPRFTDTSGKIAGDLIGVYHDLREITERISRIQDRFYRWQAEGGDPIWQVIQYDTKRRALWIALTGAPDVDTAIADTRDSHNRIVAGSGDALWMVKASPARVGGMHREYVSLHGLPYLQEAHLLEENRRLRHVLGQINYQAEQAIASKGLVTVDERIGTIHMLAQGVIRSEKP